MGSAFLPGGVGAALLLGGAGVSPAFGQVVGTGTWLWDVTTQDGDAIVHPGETATITLSLDLSPSVGEKGQSGGTVRGFGAAIFDTLGGLNADRGTILGWDLNDVFDYHAGDTTTTDGTSLFGTIAFQIPGGGPFTTEDPVPVIAFQWRPMIEGAYTVRYVTASDPEAFGVWESSIFVPWDHVFDAAISFEVVPAPGSVALPIAAMALAPRRRRA